MNCSAGSQAVLCLKTICVCGVAMSLEPEGGHGRQALRMKVDQGSWHDRRENRSSGMPSIPGNHNPRCLGRFYDEGAAATTTRGDQGYFMTREARTRGRGAPR